MKAKINHRGGSKAVAYGRYSSTKQQMQSIEGQFSECDKLARDKGICITEYFKDEAKTGLEMSNRHGLQNMLSYLDCHPDIGYIIVYKMDRLSRNDKDRVEILDRLGKMGVIVLKTAEINGTGASGYLSDSIKAIPHKDCTRIAQSDFSSDCTMRTTQGCRLARTNCAI